MPSPVLSELSLACPPQAWRRAGFAVAEHGAAQVGSVLLRFGGSGGGISGWAFEGTPAEWLDGLATRAAPAPAGPAPEHPNGARSIDHVVVGTPDLERTLGVLEAAGFDLRRTRDAGEVTQAFFRVGEAVLEVVGPTGPPGPASFWGLVVVVADLERAAAVLGERLGEARDAVQPGRRIATVRESAGLGARLALMTPPPPR